MILSSVLHEAKSRFAYAYDQNTIHLRLRTAHADISSVTLVGGDPFRWIQDPSDPNHWEWDRSAAFEVPMQLEFSTRIYDYWFVAVQPQWLRLRYGFVLQDSQQKILYGSHGFFDFAARPELQYNTFQLFNFPYINPEDIFTPPSWVADTIWYQIFPDRYAAGKLGSGSDAAPIITDQTEDVYNFYGGNLQGILDHLDDIQDLGATGIYLTPIFASPSSHKYDTSDYLQIDPAFGTNELFGQLVQAAHQRGMKVMLDAVFNHCGWFHPFWQDVVQNGKKSKYYDCFYITGDPVINFEVRPGELPDLTPAQMDQLNYRAFGFVPVMPKWNTRHPLVREYLLGVIRYWTENYGVDGWRLDVSNEVAHDFWREFRKTAKAMNPDIYIVGENWDESYPWLAGDQFDGVMNYELTYPIWNLLGSPNNMVIPISAAGFRDALSAHFFAYPKNVTPSLYNLVDSHDTPRIRHIVGGDPAKVRLAYALMFSLPGAPSVYYGSEVGLDGDGGHNRAPMVWDTSRRDLNLRSFVKQLIHLRKNHPAMRSVELKWVIIENQPEVLIYKKITAQETVYVIANVNALDRSIQLPDELRHRKILSLLDNAEVQLEEEITLPAFGVCLLLQ